MSIRLKCKLQLDWLLEAYNTLLPMSCGFSLPSANRKPVKKITIRRSLCPTSWVQVKATLLQLEVLEAGIEERLNAPPTPCLSCADWFLPAASSASPVFSKLAGAVKGSSSSRSRGRSLFGEKARRSSPQRSLADSGSDGQTDAGSGSFSSTAPGLSPHSTPDSARKLGGRRDSLGSGGSDGSGGSGGLFKVHLQSIIDSDI